MEQVESTLKQGKQKAQDTQETTSQTEGKEASGKSTTGSAFDGNQGPLPVNEDGGDHGDAAREESARKSTGGNIQNNLHSTTEHEKEATPDDGASTAPPGGEKSVTGRSGSGAHIPQMIGGGAEGEEMLQDPNMPDLDLSILKNKKVNKAGNIVDENGVVFGRLEEGADNLKRLVGKTVDGEGQIWNDAGKVIGRAVPVPEDERESPNVAPFEDYPSAIVDKKGTIVAEGKVIGKVVEGDAGKLAGKKVDADGEILDRVGNVLGKAERWEEEEEVPEPEPEPETIDKSILAGKRVNKLGNIVDSSGTIFGKLEEGDPKKLAGKMCDKNGDIWDEGGNIVGKASLIPESEREGQKQGPFAGLEGLTVDKNGKVVNAKGVIVGRLVQGDEKQLYGKEVDEDGDILDKNGNVLGKAERWEEEVTPEPEKKRGPLAGLRVNREGNVVDNDGEVIGKLIDGTLSSCVGQEIDDDGDIVNSKGQTIGHAVLLSNIPPEPEPEVEKPGETEEEAEKRKQAESDRKLAGQMATCIQQSIDKIQPILKMITETIETAERQPKEELDEQKLVDTVKPLLEQGGQILQEANGVIRGLDPDGRISANAKHKTAAREASPEEYRLADLLKELTGTVTQTIDNAKKKISGMPHAKKELNPLWGLLAEPLGQILAAVGLLLSGVLGLVGNLLSGLGLGGLLDNLLGGLGLTKILDSLGLGVIPDALTGKKKK
ncbi:hypothetical protein FQN57_001520 [Myotisia sp. PD_48]|nr:hypothetical protein FQN57_001520 [Myotisia sp. PD_48]